MIEDNVIPKAVWYGLDGAGYSKIAQEIPAEDNNKRRWVAIYALYKMDFSEDDLLGHHDFIIDMRGHKYGLVVFEVEKDKLGELDNFYEEDIGVITTKGLDSESDIYGYLKYLKVDPKLFTYPWRCDYPL